MNKMKNINDIYIEREKGENIAEIASIHKQIFGNHFLGLLPRKLIARYYQCFLNEKENIFLVCKNENEEVCGFVLGCHTATITFCRNIFIKRNFLRLGFAMLVTPKIWKMIFSRLKRQQLDVRECAFSLLSIGIREDMKRHGIGTQLIKDFEAAINKDKYPQYGLSVQKTNISAIQFYLKCGFVQDFETANLLFFRKDFV